MLALGVLAAIGYMSGSGLASSAAYYYQYSTTTLPVVSARFLSLTASRTHGGVVVRWRFASVDTLGFNVFRKRRGLNVRVNRHLISADRSVGLRTYRVVDRSAPRLTAATYWLQAVGLNGSRRWYGPARLGPARALR